MGRFVTGDIVVLDFPYSDLTQRKRRPALVLAAIARNDYVLCQITSQSQPTGVQVQIHPDDLAYGELKKVSYARPDFLATVNEQAILYHAASIKAAKSNEVVDALIRILRPEPIAEESAEIVDEQSDTETTTEEDRGSNDNN